YQQVAIVSGITLVYFVSWGIAAQGDGAWFISTGWRYLLLSAAVPASLVFGLLLLPPETPRWLAMKGGDQQAREVLEQLGGQGNDEVLEQIKDSLRSTPSSRLLAFGAGVVVIGIALSVFQQFVGINAVLYYAPLMFQNMGASTDSA